MGKFAQFLGLILLIPIALVLVAMVIVGLIGGFINVVVSMIGDFVWVIVAIIAGIAIIKIIKFFLFD